MNVLTIFSHSMQTLLEFFSQQKEHTIACAQGNRTIFASTASQIRHKFNASVQTRLACTVYSVLSSSSSLSFESISSIQCSLEHMRCFELAMFSRNSSDVIRLDSNSLLVSSMASLSTFLDFLLSFLCVRPLLDIFLSRILRVKSISLMYATNLKKFDLLGKPRPNTPLNCSTAQVVRVTRIHTEIEVGPS